MATIKARIYKIGESYEVYKDIKLLVKSTQKEIFVVEPYVDEKIFTDYLDEITSGSSVQIKLIIYKDSANFIATAEKFSGSRQIEVKKSNSIHDRILFIDNKCYVLGQSLKDAASKKPTYLIEIEADGVPQMRKIYDNIWNLATVITL